MNKWCGTGRLTRDVELKYAGETAFAKFSIAVQRDFKRDGEPDADFLNCTVFGKRAETLSQYFSKGMKIEITGRIQTGNYTNKDGVKVYTTDIMVESFGFAESKQNGTSGNGQNQSQQVSGTDGFANIPDGVDEELPFN
jgi:single-strand DNA-binding protein